MLGLPRVLWTVFWKSRDLVQTVKTYLDQKYFFISAKKYFENIFQIFDFQNVIEKSIFFEIFEIFRTFRNFWKSKHFDFRNFENFRFFRWNFWKSKHSYKAWFPTKVYWFSVIFLETLSLAEACSSFTECSEQLFGSLET